jgi:hypothetical protein
VVIMLVNVSRIRAFKPADGDGLLRAIKVRSTTSFAGKVKPEVPCRRILRHVTENYVYERDTS